MQLSTDHQRLFDAVVSTPSGVELLKKGHLESVSALFGARPAVVDEVRGWLGTRAQRKLVAEALLRARNRKPSKTAPAPAPAPPPAPETARALVQAAREVPGGDEFLLEAPLETVAIVFGVRPDLVAKARELLPAPA